MTNVFFRPWVGENYKTNGFNGKRILVLGESCYCGECEVCAEEGPQDWWDEKEWEECRNEPPRGKPRGIWNLELFLDRRLVREEIYYTVWFNTKLL